MADCSNPIGWINPIGTLATGIFIYFLNDINQKRKVKIEKLERIYSLCQKLYDGHKKQINNARHHLPHNREEYLENRVHPGEEMSEIKMLIRSYFPELINFMDELDNGHKNLKATFDQIDNDLATLPQTVSAPLESVMGDLKEISNGSTLLKNKVSQKLIEITTPFYKKWGCSFS